MPIKEIFVLVDPTPSYGERLTCAAALAQNFDAELVGCFALAEVPPAMLVADAGIAAAVIESFAAESERRAQEAGKSFRALLHKQGVAGVWRVVRGGAPSITREARLTDLVILGQEDPEHPNAPVWPADIMLACGRPTIVVPYAGQFPNFKDDILIAWNGSREASRAVHDALPFLQSARRVWVLAIAPEEGDARSAEHLAAHLKRHGVSIQVQHDTAEGSTVGDVILSRAADLGATMIVMGGYGHSRWREMALGGATQSVLRQMTVPVLFSH